jgi:protein-S-isoprenylcysteine O-methyltransferase Ste14
VADWKPQVINTRRVRAERRQGMTVIYTVMVAIMILILLQFLMLMVALEDFLSGSRNILSGAAIGSGLCFAGACWLIRYITTRRLGGIGQR